MQTLPDLPRARGAPHGALLELRIDPEPITPRTTPGALRDKALSQPKETA